MGARQKLVNPRAGGVHNNLRACSVNALCNKVCELYASNALIFDYESINARVS